MMILYYNKKIIDKLIIYSYLKDFKCDLFGI